MRERLVCVTRLMDMHACSLLASHFRVHINAIADVIIIGDLHPQQQQLVVNTDQVYAILSCIRLHYATTTVTTTIQPVVNLLSSLAPA